MRASQDRPDRAQLSALVLEAFSPSELSLSLACTRPFAGMPCRDVLGHDDLPRGVQRALVGLFFALLFIRSSIGSCKTASRTWSRPPRAVAHTRCMLFLMALTLRADCPSCTAGVGLVLGLASVLLLFAFEYLILASTVCATFSKYALHINDIRLQGRWDDKGVYLFYLELVTDMFHMLVYLAFFVLICTYYGLPLHIMRGPRAHLSNPADEPHRVPPWHDRVASRTDASLPLAWPRTWQTFTSPAARSARRGRLRAFAASSLCRSGSAPPRRAGRADRICIICSEQCPTAPPRSPAPNPLPPPPPPPASP